jgi:hypothetical protein
MWRRLQLQQDSGSSQGARRWWWTPLDAGSGHSGCNRGGGAVDSDVGGHHRLESESEVGREPSIATIGGGKVNSGRGR